MVQETSKLDPWTTGYSRLKKALIAAEVVEVPLVDRWRLPYLCSLLAQRREANSMVMEAEEDRLEELINSLVMN